MAAKIEALLRKGGAVIAFDTNALSGHNRLYRLCDLFLRLREEPHSLEVELVSPAVAHEEQMLHIWHQQNRLGRTFDIDRVHKALEDKTIAVRDFDANAAEAVAEFLAKRYPDSESWRLAKKELIRRRSGLVDLPGEHFAATVDWLIAGQAAGNSWILVTDDKGPEFAEVLLKIDYASLETLLEKMLAENPAAP